MDYPREPVFLVGQIDENADLSSPPASGEEYLKRVVIEAQRCEDVVVADFDRIRLKKTTVDVKPLAGCVEAPPQLGPTLEWQRRQVADFSDLRVYISRLKNKVQLLEHKQWKAPNFNLPDIDDETGWIELCSSLREQKTHAPTLNVIFCLNQPTVERLLEYLVAFIENNGTMEHQLGRWVYALLVVLETPLNPDACSCLRSLARVCSVIRANSKLEVHEIAALNLFICLVARYFRQWDLADP